MRKGKLLFLLVGDVENERTTICIQRKMEERDRLVVLKEGRRNTVYNFITRSIIA